MGLDNLSRIHAAQIRQRVSDWSEHKTAKVLGPQALRSSDFPDQARAPQRPAAPPVMFQGVRSLVMDPGYQRGQPIAPPSHAVMRVSWPCSTSHARRCAHPREPLPRTPCSTTITYSLTHRCLEESDGRAHAAEQTASSFLPLRFCCGASLHPCSPKIQPKP